MEALPTKASTRGVSPHRASVHTCRGGLSSKVGQSRPKEHFTASVSNVSREGNNGGYKPHTNISTLGEPGG